MAFVSSLLALLDVSTCLFFFITFLALSYFLNSRDRRHLPPGPLSLPVVGTLLTFGLKARHYDSGFKVTAAWREEFGNIYRLKFGSQYGVVIGGYKLVTEALRDHSRVLESRPNLYVFEQIAHGKGVAFSSGRIWRETRKFAVSALREMGVGSTSLEEQIPEEAQILIDTIQSESGPIYPRNLLMKATANVILKICFGQRSEYSDAEFAEFIKTLDRHLHIIGVQPLENIWPWIEHTPLANLPALRATTAVLIDYSQTRLDEHRSTYDEAHIRDLTDLYIKQRPSWKNEDMKSDFHLCVTAIDLFAAGTDTVAAYLSWLLLHAISYPDVQAKCQQEIDQHVGSSRNVMLSDKPNLVYNMAVMHEVQRHKTVLPLSIPRFVDRDVEIGGYVVPKGATAIFDLDSVHHDKGFWGEDADIFRPERWIDETGQLKTFDAYMPFSIGPRQCVGEQLALMEVFLIFTNLIQKLTFKSPPGTAPPSMDGIQFALTHIPRDYCFISERR